MIRCLITDGTASSDESLWLRRLALWMERGVEIIQIRERDLEARQLAELTRKVLALPHQCGTRILINDRADVAMATGADGVHLRDGSVSPRLFARDGFMVSATCHAPRAISSLDGADLILLAPVFNPLSKPPDRPPLGLEGIRAACALTRIRVLGLGGITTENQQECLDAGASGIAGISYFTA